MSTPQKFSRYTISREVGRGGMATLYLAHDPNFNREVAIKVLPSQFTHDPQFLARFRREAQAIASLEHPAIVPVYDFGEENGQPFLVMRYMDGGTLQTRMQKEGRLSPAACARIYSQIAGGLESAHDRGIVHRDLKPANILFDEYDNAYISDFGIAKLAEATANFTGSAIIGTPAYMSPEQVKGDDDLDGRSDVYSLGVMLFELLTGRQPYQAATPTKQLMKHVLEPVPDIRKVDSTISPALAAVVSRALAKEPADRYPTPRALARALDEVVSDRGATAAPGAALSQTLIDQGPGESTTPFPATAPSGRPRRQTAAPPPASPSINLTGEESPSERSGLPLWLIVGGVVLLLIVVVGGGYAAGWFGGEAGEPVAAVTEIASPSAAEGTATAASVATIVTGVEPEQPGETATPTPILTDTPAPRTTAAASETPAAPDEEPAVDDLEEEAAVSSVTETVSESVETVGQASSQPAPFAPGAINPFNNPDDEFGELPLPEPLPAGVGSSFVPRAGSWSATTLAGEMSCAGSTLPMPGQPASLGTLAVSDDGGQLTISGIGEEAVVELAAVPTILGRYTGALDISQEGIPAQLIYVFQVINSDNVVGYMSSEFTVEGNSCLMYRPFQMVYAGS